MDPKTSALLASLLLLASLSKFTLSSAAMGGGPVEEHGDNSEKPPEGVGRPSLRSANSEASAPVSLVESSLTDGSDEQARPKVHARRQVRQDIYNFYNSHRPTYGSNEAPYWQPRPRPRPTYYDLYDDSQPAYYPRPTYEPAYEPAYQPPYQPPYYPTVPPPTTTTSSPRSSNEPIGYMLIDTYHAPTGGRFSRPIAFFGI